MLPIYIYIYTHTHTYIYIHTHTHTHILYQSISGVHLERSGLNNATAAALIGSLVKNKRNSSIPVHCMDLTAYLDQFSSRVNTITDAGAHDASSVAFTIEHGNEQKR